MKSIVHYTADEYGSVKVKLAEVLDRRGITRNRLRESCAGENGLESVGRFGLASGVVFGCMGYRLRKNRFSLLAQTEGEIFYSRERRSAFFSERMKKYLTVPLRHTL